jgi:D-alanyl-D-alanine-carboxypeptidase/D-alanyl-D-alanine-endopeptidase
MMGDLITGIRSHLAVVAISGAMLACPPASPASAEDKLLQEVVDFTGTVLFVESKVPALIIGAVRNGETAVVGFGDADGNGTEPDGDTIMGIGSITKAFTGQVLASLVADGTVSLTDRLQDRLGWDITVPERDGYTIRLIDLATHTSGLPRELERQPGPPDDPNSTLTPEAYAKALAGDPLLFPPGTGAFYSNFAFDVLAAALANAAGKSYDVVLQELDQVGLSDTYIVVPESEKGRRLLGHNFDSKPFPAYPMPLIMAGASSLYSTANDILKWLDWHLDRFSAEGAEIRLLDHAAYVPRDGLDPVYGLDESGHMDAMSLGWIVMMPEGDRPLILQKAGGLQGIFTYAAFAPSRGVAAFVAINEFNFSASLNMAAVLNDMIATLAPR